MKWCINISLLSMVSIIQSYCLSHTSSVVTVGSNIRGNEQQIRDMV